MLKYEVWKWLVEKIDEKANFPEIYLFHVIKFEKFKFKKARLVMNRHWWPI